MNPEGGFLLYQFIFVYLIKISIGILKHNVLIVNMSS